ncbi:glutamate-rich protein 1 isoform X2 [Tupaia chinensis]|uniref:glutamate-rich protein 1 isoform X2 n=1 Tax=Tupaia chinensis TaxID=246437 RepID=UPI0003C8CD7F|nr:glutamate-rich protein 1 isoform X2 [Tupaia chinensis]
MSARRGQVFVEKVLKRLFPNAPSGQEEAAPQTSASEKPPKKVTFEKVKPKHAPPLTDSDTKFQSKRRLYTVSLPPEGYIPCLPETNSCTDSENSSSEDDTEDQRQEQPKRRRIRKHKSKKKFRNSNNAHVEQSELDTQQSLLQEKLQPHHTDGPTISKNKKRKLKKKQQIKKKKAAGLVTKTSGINFMYQPEESNSEQENVLYTDEKVKDISEEDATDNANEEDVRRTNVEDVTDNANEEDVRHTNVEDVTDVNEEDIKGANEEDIKITKEKAESILKFLKSTQEIYFYDDSDPAVCVETTEELFNHLESHRMPPSDVFILDHMKTLLLLQDIERLKSALEMFPEHCMMPPDHARVISAFFNYWITHILPEKNSE